MVNRKATRGTWKKGIKSPNPRGRGLQYMPVKKLTRIYTAQVIAEVYGSLIDKTPAELQEIVDRKETAILDQIIAKAMIKDLKTGYPVHTEAILNRIIGPIATKQEISGAQGMPLMPPQIVIQDCQAPAPAPGIIPAAPVMPPAPNAD